MKPLDTIGIAISREMADFRATHPRYDELIDSMATWHEKNPFMPLQQSYDLAAGGRKPTKLWTIVWDWEIGRAEIAQMVDRRRT